MESPARVARAQRAADALYAALDGLGLDWLQFRVDPTRHVTEPIVLSVSDAEELAEVLGKAVDR